MEQNLRLALLDSDPDVRLGRRMVLSSQPNLEIVLDSKGDTSDLSAIADGLVDVLVLDQSLAMGPGVLFYSLLREQMGLQQTPGCVLTAAFDQSALLLAALEVGVTQVVSLEQGPEALLQAIQSAKQEQTSFSLYQLHSLIMSENLSRKLDVELVKLVSELPEKLASNLRRLRSVWLKANPSQLAEFSLSNLDGLVARLQAQSAAELVIRLERSELLGEG
jgi:DNA-binding NarL/FixJ family response regulator